MSDDRTHEALVGRQFGPQAAAYLDSAVHAQGADLEALARLIDPRRTARVLDLGCGAGHVSFAAAARAKEVVAYDLSSDMLAIVAKVAAERGLANVTTQQGPAESLPFADASFDYVLSRYSAHHWRDLDAALREVARVVRDGGTIGVVDVVSPGAPLLDTWLQAFELMRDPSHVRDYSSAEWQAAAARAGLKTTALGVSRVRLDFQSWIGRMRTPNVLVDAIRALQTTTSASVSAYFEIEPDGSFCIDVGLFQAAKRTG